jgi:hypothetical protein
LDDYAVSLDKMLRMKVKEEEKLEIVSLLKDISALKSSGEQFPLNLIPQHPP